MFAVLLCVLANIRMSESSRNQEVGWVQPVDRKNETIFGQSLGAAEKLLGMKVFREKYVDKENRLCATRKDC